MRQKTLWLTYIILCSTSLCSASALYAEASETSEDRQKDTFTLYDRNRREINWQRQHKEYQHPSNAPNEPRISRDRSRSGPYDNNRYQRAPQDYEQQNMRSWNDENVPMNQPRGYGYSTNRQQTFSRRPDQPLRANYQAYYQNNNQMYDGSYAQPNDRRYYGPSDRGYSQHEPDYVRTNPKYSQIPAVPPIE